MRTYDVGVASLAICAPPKWTDNLLSHHAVPGVIVQQRGVARKISHSALLTLALTRELHETLGLSVPNSLSLAQRLLLQDTGTVHASGHLCVTLDRPAFERDVDRRLRDALESAPRPRRGRPPARASLSSGSRDQE